MIGEILEVPDSKQNHSYDHTERNQLKSNWASKIDRKITKFLRNCKESEFQRIEIPGRVVESMQRSTMLYFFDGGNIIADSALIASDIHNMLSTGCPNKMLTHFDRLILQVLKLTGI